jgi:hypothetical protein
MRITSSRLLSFLEPITVELSAKQRNHLAQLLEAYFTSRQLRVSALARGAQSSGHLSQGGYEACYTTLLGASPSGGTAPSAVAPSPQFGSDE